MKVYLLVFVVISYTTTAQKADLVQKANAFLTSLDRDGKAKTQYEFTNDERFNWHFVPRSRHGISFREFDKKQNDAAMALLKASLSQQGLDKTTAIMALENVLREVENRGASDTFRDPLNYYITIFGTPSASQPWGWRFEGHHIAMNFSSVDNRIESSTPSFFGSNPGIVLRGADRGKQVLKTEEDLGFSLVNSLSPSQLKTALVSDKAFPEILSSNVRKALPLDPRGLVYAAMNGAQKDLLMKLVNVYVDNYELGFSHKLMEKIRKAGIENLSFAWAGSLKPGSGHYYRIQGPTLLIEFDNTQNSANHVHTAVRDLTNDFGEDILREHYEKDHVNK
jgi:hypothetical protein